MLPKYNYRRRLPHIQKDHRPIFITFVSFHRWILPPEARDIVLECCLKGHGWRFDLHAAVVMPDHVHLLLTPLRREDGYPCPIYEITHAIKGASGWKINQLFGRNGSSWQAESFDHVLRSNDSLSEKVEYICQNPVRARLVRSEDEYRWLWRGKVPLI